MMCKNFLVLAPAGNDSFVIDPSNYADEFYIDYRPKV